MIFGLSFEQKQINSQKLLKSLYKTPICHFAWFPTRIDDGRIVWLRKYFILREIRLSNNGNYYEDGYYCRTYIKESK